MTQKIFTFGLYEDVFGPLSAELLGGKGAALSRMAANDIPVPPGFIITTEACNEYRASSDKAQYIDNLMKHEVLPAVSVLVDILGDMPLLSVRSGARVSMPGMMDTVLNVGITRYNLPEWTNVLGERTAWDCYRRLLQMYGDVVLGIPAENFSGILETVKKYKFGLEEAPASDAEMTYKHLQRVASRYEALLEKSGVFPSEMQDYVDWLRPSIEAVFRSWDNPRAVAYRKMHGYPDDWGTAVVVQTMVFGNKGDTSCSGVLFTRDPATGSPGVVGEYLVNAQGEDVVAGVRTPEPMCFFADWDNVMADQLLEVADKLEHLGQDMQDVEFTVEEGCLYILQTRAGKRSSEAAFRIAHDLVGEGHITVEEAIERVTYKQYKSLIKDRVDHEFNETPLVIGVPAGGGVVTGVAALTSKEALYRTNVGETVILVRKETSPDDIEGIAASAGILTATGGMTSHAAVVARGMNKACVVGATDKVLDIKAGDKVTIDGLSGRIWVGVDVPVVKGALTHEAKQVVEWAIDAADEQYVELVEPEAVTSIEVPARCHVSTARLEQEPYTLTQVLQAIFTADIEEVVVDLRTGADFKDPQDQVLWDAFGATAEDPSWKVDVLTAFDVLNNTKPDKVALVLPSSMNSTQVEAVQDAGWRVVITVKDVESLLKAKGVAELSPEFAANVGGKANAKKLLKVFEAAGQGLKPLTEARTKANILAEALGA